MKTRRHLVIPDVQAKNGIDFAFLTAIGRYAAAKKPDVILVGGDFADLPSLSSYDIGKKCFEGRTYQQDINAAKRAMDALMTPIHNEIKRQQRNQKKMWIPELYLVLGNHEDRITRAINSDRKLDGLIGLNDLGYELHGFKVFPFLEVITIDGIAYSHYFTSGAMGRPIGTAPALLSKLHQSCFAFHQQGRQISYGKRADGRSLTAILCGSCYEHDEGYMGLQGNKHWRGCYMLNDVVDGEFDEMPLSIKYLKHKYLNQKEASWTTK